MTTIHPGSIEVVMRKIGQYEESETAVPMDLVDEYVEIASRCGSPTYHAGALLYKVRILSRYARYCEALVTLERALMAYPDDISLQANWRKSVGHIAQSVQSLGEMTPEEAEFGRAYEKLIDLGCVSMTLHLSAIRHYRVSGRIERAIDIALRLYEAAANLIGVSEELQALAEVTDDARILALAKRCAVIGVTDESR